MNAILKRCNLVPRTILMTVTTDLSKYVMGKAGFSRTGGQLDQRRRPNLENSPKDSQTYRTARPGCCQAQETFRTSGLYNQPLTENIGHANLNTDKSQKLSRFWDVLA